MVTDVIDQPGALPLLQYTLTELFDERQDGVMTLKAYEALGGVSGALAQRAEEIYAGLDAAGQEATRQLFLRLVTLGEGVEDTRRRVLRAELEAILSNSQRSTVNCQLSMAKLQSGRVAIPNLINPKSEIPNPKSQRSSILLARRGC